MSWTKSDWANYTWTLLVNQLHMVDVKELLQCFENFVCDNKEWCENIAKKLLDKKGLTFAEYFGNLIKGAIPPDEIALCIIARMCKKHIAVLIGYEFWSTMKTPKFKEASIKLVYLGGMKFLSTTEGRTSHADEFYVQTLIHDLVNAKKDNLRSAVRTARVFAEALKQRDDREKNKEKSRDTMSANNGDTMSGKDGVGDTMPLSSQKRRNSSKQRKLKVKINIKTQEQSVRYSFPMTNQPVPLRMQGTKMKTGYHLLVLI